MIQGLFSHYGALKVVSIMSAIYIAVMSYAYVGTFGSYGGFVDPIVGFVIDPNSAERTDLGVVLTKGTERAIVATNEFQMICLGVTRASAFFMYPALIFIFTTKCRATMEFIQHTPFSLFTYQDLHELHIYCGWVIFVDGILHTAFHIARWSDQGNMYLLYEHFSGISGIFIFTSLLCICVPMAIEPVRKKMGYELRKYLHYFFVVFCVALAFHAPLSTIPNGGFAPIVFPTLIIWYTLDATYCYFALTEKITSTVFHVLPTGVQLSMTVSEKFQSRGGGNGGYCYVNFPWIDKKEWHAFSLFENPSDPAQRQIFIQDLGNWTHDVRMALKRDTHRPVWVQGPFSSPYDSAVEYDNQILIAGGIGITPALSVMRSNKETRRTNLIWAVRDPHMLEFFLKHAEFSTRGWNLVFYTGKVDLHIGNAKEVVTSTGAIVHVIRSRPDFAKLIPNIIYSIESQKYVPEAFVTNAKMDAIEELKDMLADLDEDTDSGMSSHEKLNQIINECNNLGFLFTDLIGDIAKDDTVANLLKSGEETTQAVNDTDANGDTKEEVNILEAIRRTTIVSQDLSAMQKAMSGFSMNDLSSLGSLGEVDEDDELDEDDVENPTPVVKRKPAPSPSGRNSHLSGMSSQPSVRFGAQPSGRMPRGAASSRQFNRAKSRKSLATRTWHAVGAEMEEFLKSEDAFRPWEADATESSKYVKGLDQSEVIDTWGALYCGGKSPLATAAAATTKEYGVSLAIESFAW